MRVIADLHLHSKYARACSSNFSIPVVAAQSKIKGIDVVGTGDMQHPKWLPELKKSLKPLGNGFFTDATGMKFMLTTEIGLIYTQDGKGRRVHLIVWAPSFEIVDQIVDELLKHGRIDYDGRPIFKLSCIQFTEMMKKISPEIEIIPAHAWTPWFSVYGDKGGFNSLTQAFGDQLKHIHAIETGISSDPAMNWRIPELDKLNIVSFSDAHSPWPNRLGREATVFEMKEASYEGIVSAVRTGKGLVETFEFFPEEGKYHLDGHRACDICLEPADSIKIDNICPKCKNKLTIGVAHRVEELAKHPLGHKSSMAKPFRYLIPLQEMIAKVYGVTMASKQVNLVYDKIIQTCGNEFKTMLDTPEADLLKAAPKQLVNAILAMRQQKIKFKPGYDGVYGEPMMEDYIIPKKTLKDY